VDYNIKSILLRGMAMSFEDVEALKTAFTFYTVPERPTSSDTTPKTIMKLRKRNITHTRIIVSPPAYGVKQHFKILLFSMFSKLRLKHV
jgi:hypothetical protein